MAISATARASCRLLLFDMPVRGQARSKVRVNLHSMILRRFSFPVLNRSWVMHPLVRDQASIRSALICSPLDSYHLRAVRKRLSAILDYLRLSIAPARTGGMHSIVRQLNIKLTDTQHEELRRHAARRRTPVAWLIKDYIDSLADHQAADGVRAHEPTQAAARGGSFEWLSDEPDLYTAADGEPVPPRTRRRK